MLRKVDRFTRGRLFERRSDVLNDVACDVSLLFSATEKQWNLSHVYQSLSHLLHIEQISVTRWLDDVFNFGHLKERNFNKKISSKVGSKFLPNS